jgi:hypothetical protein
VASNDFQNIAILGILSILRAVNYSIYLWWNIAEKKKSVYCLVLGSHRGGYEECCLLGYNAVQSFESQPTFRRYKTRHLQGWLSWVRNQHENRHACRWYVPLKRRLAFNELLGVMSQKAVLAGLTKKSASLCNNGMHPVMDKTFLISLLTTPICIAIHGTLCISNKEYSSTL